MFEKQKIWDLLQKGLDLTYAKDEKGLQYFNKAIDINPDDPVIWVMKGSARSRLEKYQEALGCFDKALEINLEVLADAWSSKGNALSKLDNHEEAIKCFDKALEINPNDFDTWTGKGISFDRLDKHEEAKKCYEKALDLKTQDKSKIWP